MILGSGESYTTALRIIHQFIRCMGLCCTCGQSAGWPVDQQWSFQCCMSQRARCMWLTVMSSTHGLWLPDPALQWWPCMELIHNWPITAAAVVGLLQQNGAVMTELAVAAQLQTLLTSSCASKRPPFQDNCGTCFRYAFRYSSSCITEHVITDAEL